MGESQMIVESTPQAAAEKAAELCRRVVVGAVEQRGVCHLALSGGSTPRPMYQQLADRVFGDPYVHWSNS